ncbi:MAG TPA: 3-hydroxyacyl-CoA dehydrogenase family protein, partial [Candidatus Binatus sp.]|nr:3-hydroxyacyl-CoA dehydrogenase family protein [Candidatus Binatus sp.]
IVNRSLMLFINESARLLDEKVATPDDIDKAFILGANHPMGPLQLADFIGLDIVVDTLKVLEKDYGGKYTPTPILQKLVSEKKLGRKTRKGFYDY